MTSFKQKDRKFPSASTVYICIVRSSHPMAWAGVTFPHFTSLLANSLRTHSSVAFLSTKSVELCQSSISSSPSSLSDSLAPLSEKREPLLVQFPTELMLPTLPLSPLPTLILLSNLSGLPAPIPPIEVDPLRFKIFPTLPLSPLNRFLTLFLLDWFTGVKDDTTGGGVNIIALNGLSSSSVLNDGTSSYSAVRGI